MSLESREYKAENVQIGARRVGAGVTFKLVRSPYQHGSPVYWSGGALACRIEYVEQKERGLYLVENISCSTFEAAAEIAVSKKRKQYEEAKALVKQYEMANFWRRVDAEFADLPKGRAAGKHPGQRQSDCRR